MQKIYGHFHKNHALQVNVRQANLASLLKTAECLKIKGLAVPEGTINTSSKYIEIGNLSHIFEHNFNKWKLFSGSFYFLSFVE